MYRDIAVELARQAGAIMVKYSKEWFDTTWKEDNSPLTIADTTINTLVIQTIATLFPDHGVLGEEESSSNYEECEYVWVCDPIDGTRTFSTGIPISKFSLALCRRGVPILWVVYDPRVDKMYIAEEWWISTCNDKPMSVSTIGREWKRSVLWFWLRNDAKYDIIQDILRIVTEKKTASYASRCSVDIAMHVAQWHLVAHIFQSTNAHDIAAAKIIVENAGGRVTDLFWEDQRYDRETRWTLLSNWVVHDEILKHLSLT